MASEETLKSATKHVMGNRQEFDELKERFESMDDWSSPAAAALAYLIAKDELETKKEKEEEEPDVYDEVREIISNHCHPFSNLSTHTATDKIFTLIYEWLDDSLAEKYFASWGAFRTDVKELFEPFIIKKSE